MDISTVCACVSIYSHCTGTLLLLTDTECLQKARIRKITDWQIFRYRRWTSRAGFKVLLRGSDVLNKPMTLCEPSQESFIISRSRDSWFLWLHLICPFCVDTPIWGQLWRLATVGSCDLSRWLKTSGGWRGKLSSLVVCDFKFMNALFTFIATSPTLTGKLLLFICGPRLVSRHLVCSRCRICYWQSTRRLLSPWVRTANATSSYNFKND